MEKSGDTIQHILDAPGEFCNILSMAGPAKVVASGFPHHIIQRGNRRRQTFFLMMTIPPYIDLMAEWCGRLAVRFCGKTGEGARSGS
ncbi:MAG: hypothetical protein V2A69_13700 [Pseudomonadota bacterium]